jgi:hypothetical protein
MVIESKRLRGIGHVVCLGEMRFVQNALGRQYGKRSLGTQSVGRRSY